MKTLSKVKGVTRKQMEILSTMSPTVLQTIINQLSLVMGEETKEITKEYENYHADKEQMKRRKEIKHEDF